MIEYALEVKHRGRPWCRGNWETVSSLGAKFGCRLNFEAGNTVVVLLEYLYVHLYKNGQRVGRNANGQHPLSK